jgi:hypothetical protein
MNNMNIHKTVWSSVGASVRDSAGDAVWDSAKDYFQNNNYLKIINILK